MNFDVVVVGGGHAGCEAAAAAARMGKKTALVSMVRGRVGALSCNPAVGGLAKGHLVRELDALGGLMGRVADATSIQFRRLNTRKGLAVQSSRCQVDIHAYPVEMQRLLAQIPELEIVEGEASDLILVDQQVTGLRLADGRELYTGKLILATGTFLSAVMHRGGVQEVGGRIGDSSASALAESLRANGLRTGRLKTGTVPRLAHDSVAWDELEVQEDVEPNGRFSIAEVEQRLPQLSCHIAYTNETTHELIRGGLDRSPLFTGAIRGTGPRYCPSIEDKVVRFADRERHLLFLEPEGLNTDRVYVNGLSTSLPEDVQLAMVRSIAGLEQAEIVQYGYAVEYDFADPRDLGPDLQHKSIRGLYLAGQVNGTSGYEEAAVQGFVAGVSAALGKPFELGRDQAYVGVLIDDLTSRGVGGEPYRMFTSRAEHRLLLREDNAPARLVGIGRELGLVTDDVWAWWTSRESRLSAAKAWLAAEKVRPTADVRARFEAAGVSAPRKPLIALELLRRPDVDWPTLCQLLPDVPALEPSEGAELKHDVMYAGYIERAEKRAAALRRMEGVRIPDDVVWDSVTALSNEVRQRLTAARPASLGAMRRLPGITPAAVNIVAGWLAARRNA